MKKILLIACFLGISSPVFTEDLDTIEASLKNSRPYKLPELAANLSALGSLYHKKGNYSEAVKKFEESLMIRKQLGLVRTPGYANILLLSSISDHKMGQSCKAFKKAQKAKEVFMSLGEDEVVLSIETEALPEYKASCNTLAFKD
jgi:tetratricopeptide (TPR) repeat protein